MTTPVCSHLDQIRCFLDEVALVVDPDHAASAIR
jgi:hypothetical protein